MEDHAIATVVAFNTIPFVLGGDPWEQNKFQKRASNLNCESAWSPSVILKLIVGVVLSCFRSPEFLSQSEAPLRSFGKLNYNLTSLCNR